MYKTLISLLEVHTESLASWSQISSGRHRKLKKKIHKKIMTIMLLLLLLLLLSHFSRV